MGLYVYRWRDCFGLRPKHPPPPITRSHTPSDTAISLEWADREKLGAREAKPDTKGGREGR